MPADRSRISGQGIAAVGDDETIGGSSPPPMPTGGIAFAPNITPGTFNYPPPLLPADASEDAMLFPPQADDALLTRKAHGRKKPENYIPRPPNAFILFRSAFIRNQHVSTGVETNHSTLSKIIGLTWQNLPNEERQIWHNKAKQAEEQHRLKFPQYAFKPLHSKKKGGKRRVREVGPKDHTRCAKIAELLVQGKKGKDLDEAVKEFDKHHVPEVVTRFEAPITEESFRESSPEPVSIKEEEHTSPWRTRASSSRRSHCSASTAPNVPSPLSNEILPLPPMSQEYHDEHDAPYMNVPGYEQFPFDSDAKEEQTFDFTSFTFNPVVHSSSSLYQFDSQSQGIHPLDNTFVQPSSQTSIIPPHLSLDTALARIRNWSRCNSPGSPSTNTNSMPTTPAYSGTPPPTGQYRPSYSAESHPEHPAFSKSPYDTVLNFNSYRGLTSRYDEPVPIVQSHCEYPPTQMQTMQTQGSDLTQVDLNYSFMASYSL